MSETSLKAVIFYVTAAFALVAAVPAPGMLPGGVLLGPGSGELESISTDAPSIDATSERTDSNSTTAPQCLTNGDSAYNVSVSSLLHGQEAVAKHLEVRRSDTLYNYR